MHRSDLREGHGRRAWLLAVPAGLGLVALGWTARRWWCPGGSDPCASQVPGFPTVAEGQRLQRWTVVRVHPLHLGAVPIVLETEAGQRYQVDVLARDPEGPEGVAHTDRLSLFVVNSQPRAGADGRRTTDEEQGLGAMVLAQALAEQEPPPGLLTHAQRQRAHAGGAFVVPLA